MEAEIASIVSGLEPAVKGSIQAGIGALPPQVQPFFQIPKGLIPNFKLGLTVWILSNIISTRRLTLSRLQSPIFENPLLYSANVLASSFDIWLGGYG